MDRCAEDHAVTAPDHVSPCQGRFSVLQLKTDPIAVWTTYGSRSQRPRLVPSLIRLPVSRLPGPLTPSDLESLWPTRPTIGGRAPKTTGQQGSRRPGETFYTPSRVPHWREVLGGRARSCEPGMRPIPSGPVSRRRSWLPRSRRPWRGTDAGRVRGGPNRADTGRSRLADQLSAPTFERSPTASA